MLRNVAHWLAVGALLGATTGAIYAAVHADDRLGTFYLGAGFVAWIVARRTEPPAMAQR